jgi:hypothetical protein
MTEFLSGSTGGRHLLGRRVTIILPIAFITIITMALIMRLPVRYHFKVNNGEMTLTEARLSWLGGKQSEAIAPFTVGDADFKELLKNRFDTAEDAIASLREYSVKKLQEHQGKVIALERELVGPYSAYLGYLSGAAGAGVEGVDRDIHVIQEWIDYYREKTQRKSIPMRVSPTPLHAGKGTGDAGVTDRGEMPKAFVAIQKGSVTTDHGHGNDQTKAEEAEAKAH